MKYDLLIHLNREEPAALHMALGYADHLLEAAPEGKCRAAVVVNGPAVKFFRRENPEFAEAIRAHLKKPGVTFTLCQNALRKNGISEEEIVGGCRFVPAGIVELIRLQQEGFSYVKP